MKSLWNLLTTSPIPPRTIVGEMPAKGWHALTHEEQGLLLLVDDYLAGRYDDTTFLLHLSEFRRTRRLRDELRRQR